MLEAFNNPQGIAVDTHAKRISNRLGLSHESNPLKIEKDLLKIIPKDLKIHFIDVGQGDSTLIITPTNKKILIDSGIPIVSSMDICSSLLGNLYLNPYQF